MKKFAVFDIDGTLFRSSLYIELASELIDTGYIGADLAADIALKRQSWHGRESNTAYQEFDLVISDGIDQLLTSIPVSVYEQAVERTIKKNSDKIYSYTRGLIAQLRSEGYMIIAVSGSPKELVEQFVAHYEFDIWVGQHWVQRNGSFTGEIIKTHTGKDKILKKLIEEHDLTLEGSYGIGDTQGDIGILSMVDNAVAFNPTYELIEAAQANGWTIVVERKNICYTLKPNNTGSDYVLNQFTKV